MERAIVLYGCEDQQQFCERFALHCFMTLKLKIIHCPIRWDKFPDGTPNVFIHEINRVRNAHVVFVASFLEQSKCLDQLRVIRVLAESHPSKITVILPFFPCGTMERVDREGQMASANIDAFLLDQVTSVQGVRRELIIYDLHTLQNRFYQGLGCFTSLISGVPLLWEQLQKEFGPWKCDQYTIAFPDDGARKRFSPLFPGRQDMIVCAKVRHGDERIVRIAEGTVTPGRCIIIVDDLVQSGGTLLECARLLRANGATTVRAFATHAVFPNRSWEKFTDNDCPISLFYITNSVPSVIERLSEYQRFRVLDLASDYQLAHFLN